MLTKSFTFATFRTGVAHLAFVVQDVGALKQADVGVALLSGFGNINVDRTDEKEESDEETKNEPQVTAMVSQEHLNQLRQLP